MPKPEPIHTILMATLERHNCLGSVRGFWHGEWHKQKAQHHEAGPAKHEVPYSPAIPGQWVLSGQWSPSEFLGMGRSDHICNLQLVVGVLEVQRHSGPLAFPPRKKVPQEITFQKNK